MLIDDTVQSEAYVGVTNQRLFCVLLSTRLPLPVPMPFACPLGSVVGATRTEEGVAMVSKAHASTQESAFVLHTGPQEAELRAAIAAVTARPPK